MRSINPMNEQLTGKIGILRRLVDQHKPQVIALVETWLQQEHSNQEVLSFLGLHEYDIVGRQDRADGHHPENAYDRAGKPQQADRGGGVLVLWKRNTLSNILFVRSKNEDYADNVVNFDIECTFNCAKCHRPDGKKKFIFTVVYRRPSPTKKDGKFSLELLL